MKKFGWKLVLPLVLFAALLFAVLPGFAAEDTEAGTDATKAEFSVTADKTGNLKPGDIFYVTVKLDNDNTNLAAFGYSIYYNTAAVEVVKEDGDYVVTKSKTLGDKDFSFAYNYDTKENCFKVSGSTSKYAKRLTTSTDLFTIKYKVKDDAPTCDDPERGLFGFQVTACAALDSEKDDPTNIESSPEMGTTQAVLKDLAVKPTVKSIAVTGLADTYSINQAVDFTNAKAVVSYSDSTATDTFYLTSDNCDISTTTLVKDKVLKVKFDGNYYESNFKYTVTKAVKELQWASTPTEIVYIAGKDTALDVSGGKIKVFYDYGAPEEVALKSDWCTGFDASTAAEDKNTITVTYAGKTLTYQISWDKEAKAIEFKTKPSKTDFVQTEDFVVDGQIQVKYTDGSTSNPIDITEELCSGYDMSKTGKQTVTITYQKLKITYDINVAEKVVTNAVLTAPTKTSYVEEEATALDLAGGKWTLTYNSDSNHDGTYDTEDVSLSDAKTVFTNYDLAKVGDYTVKAEATFGKSTAEGTFALKVITKTPDKIEIDWSNPPKTAFIQDQEFTREQGKVIVTYNNKKTSVFNLSDTNSVKVDSSAYTKGTAGTYKIYVSYTYNNATVSTDYDVVVAEKELVSIAIATKPSKTDYILGEDLDLTGGTIKPAYNNGIDYPTILMTATGVNVTGYDKAKTGVQTLTVAYTEKGITKTAAFEVNVKVCVTENKAAEKPAADTQTKEELPKIENSVIKTSDSAKSHSETQVAKVVTPEKIYEGIDELNKNKPEGQKLDNSKVKEIIEISYKFADAKVATEGSKTTGFTVNITPVANVTLVEIGNENNKCELGKDVAVDLTGDAIEMSIALPDNFLEVGQKAYVQHKGIEIVKNVATDQNNQKVVSFTNTGGFSEFGVTAETKAEAVNKDTTARYLSFQQAVDEVQNGQTLELLKDNLTATVNRVVYFYLSGKYKTAKLTAADGYVITVNDDGMVTVTEYVAPAADANNPKTGIETDNAGYIAGIIVIAAICMAGVLLIRKTSVK